MFWDSPTTLSSDPPAYDPRAQTQTVFKVQLYVCTSVGLFIFLVFCITRYAFPLVYSVRPYRNKMIKRLPDSMWGWIKVLYLINNDEFLQVAGLDSYVFLCFFRFGIKVCFTLTVIGIVILSPLRYFFTGHFDRDDNVMTLLFYSFSDRQYKSNDTQNAAINYSGSTGLGSGSEGGGSDEPESDPTGYLLVCTIFTYNHSHYQYSGTSDV
ncbi:unnamed protein product [Ambrosiozyma monospora]|uniref:Unnamed protein product n=1 Tax=Ambrosiozyma monospora TaxID=43982 RepID=A0A9W7DIT4_AMBMO|nr:unnamed protein product [Ambrosiozyma monospora]